MSSMYSLSLQSGFLGRSIGIRNCIRKINLHYVMQYLGTRVACCAASSKGGSPKNHGRRRCQWGFGSNKDRSKKGKSSSLAQQPKKYMREKEMPHRLAGNGTMNVEQLAHFNNMNVALAALLPQGKSRWSPAGTLPEWMKPVDTRIPPFPPGV